MTGDWIFDHFGWILGTCALLLAALMAVAVIALVKEDKAEAANKAKCLDRGGAWVVDHYKAPYYVKAGNVMVPTGGGPVYRCDGAR